MNALMFIKYKYIIFEYLLSRYLINVHNLIRVYKL